ncbi:hypothetical protein AVEN_13816-1 [Araneus ventricosus]|uniref:Uncharacterized protein n=1 Tax=Araneus ventricosus TaxID=182803 RepID=A0A4Y2VKP8_ARAVE|nr:hypothetical protein AVEN_13816-1 [Araneus ventricosus]
MTDAKFTVPLARVFWIRSFTLRYGFALERSGHHWHTACTQLIPLHLHRRKLGSQYYFRIQSHLNHPVRLLSTLVGLSSLYAAISPRLYLSTRE